VFGGMLNLAQSINQFNKPLDSRRTKQLLKAAWN